MEQNALNRRIPELDALRGIFMLMIFLFHVHLFPNGGKIGVTFFFVLSGFSMTLGYRNKIITDNFSYKAFLNKRLIKIIPIHWLTLGLAVILKIIEIVVSGFKISIIPQFLANFFLVQSWIPDPEYYLSFNSVSWYLSDTLFFIAIFPLLIRFVVNVPKVIQIVVAIISISFYCVVVKYTPQLLYIFPLVRLLDFVLGVYLAFWLLNRKTSFYEKLSKKIHGITNFIIIGCFILIASLIVESIMLGDLLSFVSVCYWPAIVTIIVCVTLISICNGGGYNLLQNKILQWLGSISFSFYMIHQLVYKYCYLLYHHILHTDNVWFLVPTVFIISLLSAFYLEKYCVHLITIRKK